MSQNSFSLTWEDECQKKWEQEDSYTYDIQNKKNKPLFVIDTPPPTISGSLHIGHVFSYTQTDILARFQRMKGKNVFYPMGWDNNGLPTEKRVQNLYKINCRPSLSPQKEWEGFSLRQDSKTLHSVSPSRQELAFLKHLFLRKDNKKISTFLPVSRRSFVQVCERQAQEDQKKYEQLWRKLALSVDWSQTYETISPHSQALSQKSFLDLYQKSYVENRFSPVYWDTQFQTAVAQADLEDRQVKGYYHNIRFSIEGEKKNTYCIISTTRPELLPACVALAAHPNDERYQKYFYKKAITPLFFAKVPVLPSPHADPDKGTGLLMICTFGDREDVEFWQNINNQNKPLNTTLPLKQIFDQKGFIKSLQFKHSSEEAEEKGKDKEKHSSFLCDHLFSLKPQEAHRFYSNLKGLSLFQARKKIVEILKQTGDLTKDPSSKIQFVKFYEKGEFPLELLPARQWFVKVLDYKEQLLKQGSQIQWHPSSMFRRYEEWVQGLNQNWCISRQRFFGVPFPIWYPLDDTLRLDYKNPLLPDSASCPIDPETTAPADIYRKQFNKNLQDTNLYKIFKNYTEDKRGKPGGFIADTSVMDTWATSSLSPQINSHWSMDSERHKKLFPADLRPQAHEIIRTWAFYTIAKSFFHEHSIPWKHIVVSGWVTTPQRLKLSKSKGGSVSPEELILKYSADALRYWAGKARLGQDTVYDENMFKNGKRLAIKLSNAFRFMKIQTNEDSPTRDLEKKEGPLSFQAKFLKTFLTSINVPVDIAWIQRLLRQHELITKHLDEFQYAQALDIIEKSFWLFCDNYLELVKSRAYQLKNRKEGQSALCTLDVSLYLFIKMLAPYMPYITERLWIERYSEECSSVHTSSWDLDLRAVRQFLEKGKEAFKGKEQDSSSAENFLDFVFEIINQVRAKKSSEKKSLSAPLKKLTLQGSVLHQNWFNLCKPDIVSTCKISPENIIFLMNPSPESLLTVDICL